MQRVGLQERQEGRVVGVLTEAPFDAIDEVAQHAITELRPAPGTWPHQRGQQDDLAIDGAACALVQQMVHGNRPPRALPTKVPRVRQLQRVRLFEQGLQHLLVHRKIIDAGPLTAGQAVAGQVTADHGETLLECPLDHMSVEAHVVVIAVQQEQRRAWLLGQPCLPDQVEPRCLKAAQPAVCRQVQAIEALVVLRLCRQWLASGERRQAGAQAVGVKGRGHRVHPH
ncbi:hypothetical protein D3C79_645380 [compost metagenome]